MSQAVTFAQAIGEFLSEFRDEYNLTLDQVARTARKYGASWSASSVRNIELGKATTSLPNLICLALALGELSDRELTLSDLLGEAREIDGPSFLGIHPVRRGAIDRILGDTPVVLDASDDFVGTDIMLDGVIDLLQSPSVSQSLSQLKSDMPAGYRVGGHPAFKDSPPSLAEERAAAKLGIRPAALRTWAHHLWGISLEEEASRRAEVRAQESGRAVTAQARGAMTRELLTEIQQAWEE